SSSPLEIFKMAVDVSIPIFKEFLTNTNCPNLVFQMMINRSYLMVPIIGQISAAVNAVTSFREALPFVRSLAFPEEFNYNIQILQGRLIKGWLKLTKTELAKPTYAASEKVSPVVGIEAIEAFGVWAKDSFEVRWTVEEGNGKLNSSKSSTDNKGDGTIEWTLPPFQSGIYKLKGQVLDKQGYDIKGSPVIFEIKSITILGDWQAYEIRENGKNQFQKTEYETIKFGDCPSKYLYSYEQVDMTLNSNLSFNLTEQIKEVYSPACGEPLKTFLNPGADQGT
ncbi:MAG TPA: hypothetical protein VF679_13290, partial [Pedobacter sp.]